MSDDYDQKQRFMKNYADQGGIYDPESYYRYHQACVQAEKDYANATYGKATSMIRAAKNQAFNRFLRK